MSHHLDQLLTTTQRTDCYANDQAIAHGTPILARDAHRSNFTLTFPRTEAHAFRTPEYAAPIVHYTRPTLWQRFKRWVRS